MWICLNEAFISFEAHRLKPDYLIVKAYRDGDIEKLFPDIQVWEEEAGECRYRAQVGRQEAAYAVMDKVVAINYFKFQKSINDKRLQGTYSQVWPTLLSLGKVRGLESGSESRPG